MPFRALYAIAFLCVSVAPAVSAEPEIARTEIIQISEAPAPEVLASANILQADPTFSEKRMYREIFPGPESRTGAVIGSQAEKLAGEIHQHHLLPQAKTLRPYFEKAGLNIEEFKIPLSKERHILKPDGVHTGPNNWNKQWRDFFKTYPDATKAEILEQLTKMRGSFGI